MTLHTRVLCADPPWRHGDQLPGKGRGATKHYTTMTTDEICRFALPPLQDNAMLLLWRVASMPQEALDVVKAWDFVPKAEIVWCKTPKNGKAFCEVCGAELNDCACDAETKLHFGMGHYTRGSHETAILATRGKFKVADRATRSVFFAPVGVHSEKPEAFYALVEKLAGQGPFVELFARRPRLGWHCYGEELPQGYVWTPRESDLKKQEDELKKSEWGGPALVASMEANAKPPKRGRRKKADAAKAIVADMVNEAVDERNRATAPLPEAWQPERLDRLQAQLAEYHVKVTMVDICAWTPEQRQQARAWLMIGHDGPRPHFFPSACAACDRGEPFVAGSEYKHTGHGTACAPHPENVRSYSGYVDPMSPQPMSALDAMRAKAKVQVAPASNGGPTVVQNILCTLCGGPVSERNSSRVGDKIYCSAKCALAESRTLPLPVVEEKRWF